MMLTSADRVNRDHHGTLLKAAWIRLHIHVVYSAEMTSCGNDMLAPLNASPYYKAVGMFDILSWQASQDKKSLDVGANLFVGNLDPDVDEKLLYDTFSAFGVVVTNPKLYDLEDYSIGFSPENIPILILSVRL
ncbi:hypothetical protein AXF42_Ash021554 [Apostasia shenzhenica]|uniref:RRM domain-containing protein n=1 Tax=Apostasia shenzhenica TaxID=1088818 RepID=A0A2H9ZSQ0_9ASPA|nr:hypothetical protein AXF42_Ash021554 [Apostasia shenzhenica]